MAKTIHIHLHGLARITKRTGDAGNFDESKHKRDDDGKFSSGGGGGGKAPTEGKSGAELASMRGKTRKEQAAINAAAAAALAKPVPNAVPGQRGLAPSSREDQVLQAKSLPIPGKPTYQSLTKHPMYSKEDMDYLRGKGYDPGEILAFWDRDHKAGKSPVGFNKNSKENQQFMSGMRKAMFGTAAPAAAPSPQGSWSATAHNATIAAAEDASNEAWSSGSHKKAIAAFEKAIASTQQAIKVGSPKYAGERQQQLKRLQERLNHHKQAAR